MARCFITNVERSETIIWHRNYGLLIMGQVYFHHSWTIREARPKSVCAYQRSCIVAASFMLQEADALFKTILTPETASHR
jgi:hypothetical protein